MIGEVKLVAGSQVPHGHIPCDGRLLRVSDYPDLFNVIRNCYGGDGITTFALPNLNANIHVSNPNKVGKTNCISMVAQLFQRVSFALHRASSPRVTSLLGIKRFFVNLFLCCDQLLYNSLDIRKDQKLHFEQTQVKPKNKQNKKIKGNRTPTH
jgi:hypothetical protein